MASEYLFRVLIKENPDETVGEDLGEFVVTTLNAALTPPAYCFSAEIVS